MSMPSQMPPSNMVSKLYCPGCGGFRLVKLHRNFIQKRVLDAPNKLFCQKCEKVLSPKDFDDNEPKVMPAFIEESVDDTPDDLKDISEEAVEEIQVSETEIPSLDISEFTSTSSDELSPPKKRNQKLLWMSYTSLFLVVGGLGYFGYQYMRGGLEVVSDMPGLSASTLVAPEKKVITDKVPEAQKSLATEIESVKADSLDADAGGMVLIENKELTTKPDEVNLDLEKKVDSNSVEVVASGTELEAQGESLEGIMGTTNGLGTVASVSVMQSNSNNPAIGIIGFEHDKSTIVVDKQQDLIVVPALDTEIRIVLPFIESTKLKDTIVLQSKINKKSIVVISEKESREDDAMLEKAVVELLKSDLDSLF